MSICSSSNLISLKKTSAMYAVVLILTACNQGGNDSDPTPAPDIPPDDPACKLGENDTKLLKLVNEARGRSRQCGGTSYPSVAPLKWNCTLESVALSHSQDMGDNNFFSHTGSDGLKVGNRITNSGYNFESAGENIAAGYRTPERVVEGWLASDGHCRNIMSSSYTEMAVALYEVSGSDYPIYWTQVFARPSR